MFLLLLDVTGFDTSDLPKEKCIGVCFGCIGVGSNGNSRLVYSDTYIGIHILPPHLYHVLITYRTLRPDERVRRKNTGDWDEYELGSTW